METTIQFHRCGGCRQPAANKLFCVTGKPCQFVKGYQDTRGNAYMVRPSVDGDMFKIWIFCESDYEWCNCAVYSLGFAWKDTFDEAQTELNYIAYTRLWEPLGATDYRLNG